MCVPQCLTANREDNEVGLISFCVCACNGLNQIEVKNKIKTKIRKIEITIPPAFVWCHKKAAKKVFRNTVDYWTHHHRQTNEVKAQRQSALFWINRMTPPMINWFLDRFPCLSTDHLFGFGDWNLQLLAMDIGHQHLWCIMRENIETSS